MRLDENSIDDLHQMATAEMEDRPDAVATLHALYARLRDQYIAVYRELREKAAGS